MASEPVGPHPPNLNPEARPAFRLYTAPDESSPVQDDHDLLTDPFGPVLSPSIVPILDSGYTPPSNALRPRHSEQHVHFSNSCSILTSESSISPTTTADAAPVAAMNPVTGAHSLHTWHEIRAVNEAVPTEQDVSYNYKAYSNPNISAVHSDGFGRCFSQLPDTQDEGGRELELSTEEGVPSQTLNDALSGKETCEAETLSYWSQSSSRNFISHPRRSSRFVPRNGDKDSLAVDWWLGYCRSTTSPGPCASDPSPRHVPDDRDKLILDELSIEVPSDTQPYESRSLSSVSSTSVDPWGRSNLPFPNIKSWRSTPGIHLKQSQRNASKKDRSVEGSLQCCSSLFLRRAEQQRLQHRKRHSPVEQRSVKDDQLIMQIQNKSRTANQDNIHTGDDSHNHLDVRSLFLSLCVGNNKNLYNEEDESVLPLDSYTPREMFTLDCDTISLQHVQLLLASLMAGDPRVGALTSCGFHLAWQSHKYIEKLLNDPETSGFLCVKTQPPGHPNTHQMEGVVKTSHGEGDDSLDTNVQPKKSDTPWQATFGYSDTEWPRFVCGTIDRRWCIQQTNALVPIGCNEQLMKAECNTGDVLRKNLFDDVDESSNRSTDDCTTRMRDGINRNETTFSAPSTVVAKVEAMNKKQCGSIGEVSLQFEEFAASAAQFMWPEPIVLPEKILPGLEVQIGIFAGGRHSMWWVDGTVSAIDETNITCTLCISESADASTDADRCGESKLYDECNSKILNPTKMKANCTNDASGTVMNGRRFKSNGMNGGFNGTLLEKPALREPKRIPVGRFCPPQVPVVNPSKQSWRLRPRRLNPETDLYPGSVICIPGEVASLRNRTLSIIPSFLMKDVVVYQVYDEQDVIRLRQTYANRATTWNSGYLWEESSHKTDSQNETMTRLSDQVPLKDGATAGWTGTGDNSSPTNSINPSKHMAFQKEQKHGNETRRGSVVMNSINTTSPDSSLDHSTVCFDGRRSKKNISHVVVYCFSTRQQRFIPVGHLLMYQCYKIPYDLHAHFPESGLSVTRQADDYLWTVPRALLVSDEYTRLKTDSALFYPEDITISELSTKRWRTDDITSDHDHDVWDVKTDSLSLGWVNYPPFCVVYVAMENPCLFKLPKCRRVMELLQPELCMESLSENKWKVTKKQWNRSSKVRTSAFVCGSGIPDVPCMVSHPSDGPFPQDSIGVVLRQWIARGLELSSLCCNLRTSGKWSNTTEPHQCGVVTNNLATRDSRRIIKSGSYPSISQFQQVNTEESEPSYVSHLRHIVSGFDGLSWDISERFNISQHDMNLQVAMELMRESQNSRNTVRFFGPQYAQACGRRPNNDHWNETILKGLSTTIDSVTNHLTRKDTDDASPMFQENCKPDHKESTSPEKRNFEDADHRTFRRRTAEAVVDPPFNLNVGNRNNGRRQRIKPSRQTEMQSTRVILRDISTHDRNGACASIQRRNDGVMASGGKRGASTQTRRHLRKAKSRGVRPPVTKVLCAETPAQVNEKIQLCDARENHIRRNCHRSYRKSPARMSLKRQSSCSPGALRKSTASDRK